MSLLGVKVLLSFSLLVISVNGQTPPQPILVPSLVSAGQPLTVFCDPYRLVFDLSTVNYVASISIIRKTKTDTIENTVAVYTIFGPISDNFDATIPQNRNWTVAIFGNGTKGDTNAVKLQWTLYDTKLEDAGTYRCEVTFMLKPNNRPDVGTYLMNLTVLVNSHTQPQPILVPSTISPGQPLIVFCDPYRVSYDLTNVKYVNSISILRKTSTDTIEDTIAVYTIFGPISDQTFVTIPNNRNWAVATSGTGTNGDLNAVKLQLTLYDTKCEDEGTYRCEIDFTLKPNNRPAYVTYSSKLTFLGPVPGMDISVSPPSVTGDMSYNVGDNITLTCRVRGPASLSLRWDLWVKESDNGSDVFVQKELPPSIAGPTQPASTGTCTPNTKASTLRTTVSYFQEIYKCFVSDAKGKVLYISNALIYVQPTQNGG